LGVELLFWEDSTMRYKQMPLHPSQVMLFVTSVEDALPPESDVRRF